jgi:hypothetical protein
MLRGLTVVPSVRWWLNVATSLTSNEYEYENARTGETEIHEANKIGLSDTPFFVNISIGYTFNLRKQ